MKNKQYIVGKLTEKSLARLLKKVIEASEEQDKTEHWDIQGELDDELLKIDAKSLKRQNRYDPLPNENHHWVEYQNVRGNTGWLYGEADAFAFEVNDFFILVRKSVLQKFMEEKTKGKVLEGSKDPYTLYQRKGRKDIVVKVKTLDLMRISFKCLEKINDEQADNEE